MAIPSDRVKGSCNCGAITISITASEFPKSCALCHCLNCRASSGGLFSVNLPIPTSAVEIVSGKPKIFTDIADTGNHVDRNFCGDCGTAIMSIVKENSGIAFVKGGLFKRFGVPLPKPNFEVFLRNKENWYETVGGVTIME